MNKRNLSVKFLLAYTFLSDSKIHPATTEAFLECEARKIRKGAFSFLDSKQ